MIRPKYIFIPFIVIILFIVWSTYSYFFDTSAPEIYVQGLEHGAYCSGDTSCILRGNDSYKVADISVWLDGRLIVNKFKVNKKEFEHPLNLPTKSLPNGKHLLKIEVFDASYNRNKTFKEISFNVDNSPLQAAFVRPDNIYKIFQGRTLHLQFQVNKEIKLAVINLLSKSFVCFPESKGSTIYECFIPISCEELPNEYPLSILITDNTGKTFNLDSKMQVMPFPFKEQKLTIGQDKVKEEELLGKKQEILEAEIEELTKKSPMQKLWQGEFYVPLDMTKVVCDFGTKRVTQEKGRYMHKAIDIIGMPKTVVWAPQDGVIVVKDRFVQSGNTIVIDHGWGILSLLYHLDNFANINVGDKVKRGNPVGTMGKTGFATGYHLHWEMRINNIHVDPMQWVKCDF